MSDKEIKTALSFKDEGRECLTERTILIRNVSPENVVEFVSKYTGKEYCINIKFIHRNTELKALCVVIMRSLCNFTLSEISSIIGNVTASNVWRLCEKGYDLLTSKEKYKTIIDDLINSSKTA